MRSYMLLVALLQSLRCSGVPLYSSELESMSHRGLGAALVKVNSVYAGSHLYRVTQASVTRVVPVGLNTADLLMVFGIKETECATASGSDPQTCAFRPGFFVPTFTCSGRLRMSSTSAQVLSLKCGHDSGSSSSSSEEISSRGRHQFNIPFANRVPAPSAPAPPPPPSFQPGHSLHRQPVEVQPRGDTFSNFLV